MMIHKCLAKHETPALLCTQASRTPLHYAAKNGHLEVAEALLDAQAEVDARTEVSHGSTQVYLVVMAHRRLLMTWLDELWPAFELVDQVPCQQGTAR